MASSARSQFEELIVRAGRVAHAHLCSGDPDTGVVWDRETEIPVRLSLHGDEVWLVAGSGVLIRFIENSEHELDVEGILSVLAVILSGEAVEYFGAQALEAEPIYATGYAIGDGFAGGLTQAESRFAAVLAGPMRNAAMPIPD